MKLTNSIDKIGTIGVFLTALLSPCCFPFFAFAASALGLGSFELFGGWTMWVFQAMVIISLAGFVMAYRVHRYTYPLLIALPSATLVFYGYYINESDYWQYLLYAGMFGLLIATVINYQRNKLYNACATCDIDTAKNQQNIELNSTITCPNCGYKKMEAMPTNACMFFYECENCKTRLKPKEGDCCVFCSYGSIKCPPIQTGSNCCN